MIAFSIPEKMFLKIENLMCALRTHINRAHKFIHYQKGGVSLKISLNFDRMFDWDEKQENTKWHG